MFETKAIEVAVGQITGYINPSEAERRAAYELFVELSTRTATVGVDDEEPSVRSSCITAASPYTTMTTRTSRTWISPSSGSAWPPGVPCC